MTSKFFLPYANLESFKKLAKKVQKHVDMQISYSQSYKKTFNHPVINENGMRGHCEKYVHEVVDVTIVTPDFNDWELVATYKDGSLFVTDYSKELVFLNKEHGANYHKCDCCGHTIRKEMFVVRNNKTNEELQVGSECAKTYGIEGLKWVSKFYAELYKIYDYRLDYNCGEEDFPTWRGGADCSAFRSVKVSDVIKSSKLYYTENNGIWNKGHYEGRTYYPSSSKETLTNHVINNEGECTEEYINSVKEFVNSTLANKDNEFYDSICENVNGYYMSLADVHFIFFAVKYYEENILAEKFGNYKEGEQLHIVGDIISDKVVEGYYGSYHVITIQLENGRKLVRKGAVPNIDGKVNAYAFVDSVWNNTTYLSRVTKNPKKGYEVVETK